MNILQIKSPWPPEYSLRISKKAKNPSLRVTSAKGLEVVLPVGMSPKYVPAMLEKHQAWIKRHLELRRLKLENVAEQFSEQDNHASMSVLQLHGGSLAIPIEWLDAPEKRCRIFASSDLAGLDRTRAEQSRFECRLYVNDNEYSSKRSALLAWVRAYANWYLPPLLQDEAKKSGLSCNSLRIKLQKTRWGSCSRKGNINLNAKLIFLPENMVRAIILHELCHTRHMNHSEDFWSFFHSLNPEAVRLDRAINKTLQREHWVPRWFPHAS